ncbi:Dipeptidase 3-like [Homarus americanus]|uniref:Dipeptidase n=1 Tax=Homarus americanus TaxID=6706 RepID=A0A8J5MTJ6_HOMAM|nr:Dipeptidase 3-like [Homarus americanus]
MKNSDVDDGVRTSPSVTITPVVSPGEQHHAQDVSKCLYRSHIKEDSRKLAETWSRVRYSRPDVTDTRGQCECPLPDTHQCHDTNTEVYSRTLDPARPTNEDLQRPSKISRNHGWPRMLVTPEEYQLSCRIVYSGDEVIHILTLQFLLRGERGRTTVDMYRAGRTTVDMYRAGRTTVDMYRAGRTTVDMYRAGRTTVDMYRAGRTTVDMYLAGRTTVDMYRAGRTTVDMYRAGRTTVDMYRAGRTTVDMYLAVRTTVDMYRAGRTTVPEETRVEGRLSDTLGLTTETSWTEGRQPSRSLEDLPGDIKDHILKCQCSCDHLGYGNYSIKSMDRLTNGCSVHLAKSSAASDLGKEDHACHHQSSPTSKHKAEGGGIGTRTRAWVCVVVVLAGVAGVGVGVPLALRVDPGASLEQRLTTTKTLLTDTPLFDGHNDLPWNIRKFMHNKLHSFNFTAQLKKLRPWSRSSWSHTDLPRLKEGMVGAQFWVSYVPCESQRLNAVQLTIEQIDLIKRLIDQYPDDLRLATSADE